MTEWFRFYKWIFFWRKSPLSLPLALSSPCLSITHPSIIPNHMRTFTSRFSKNQAYYCVSFQHFPFSRRTKCIGYELGGKFSNLWNIGKLACWTNNQRANVYTAPHDDHGDDEVKSWSLVIVYNDISSNIIQSDAQQNILTGQHLQFLRFFLCVIMR